MMRSRSRVRIVFGVIAVCFSAVLEPPLQLQGDASQVRRVWPPAVHANSLLWALDNTIYTSELPGGGGGGRGGRGRGGAAAARGVVLPGEPTGLTQFAAADPELTRLASSVAARLDWPGKPAPVVIAVPLTPDEQVRFTAGGELYKNLCLGCHQADGRGREKMAPSLVGSRYVVAPDSSNAARIRA